MFSPLPLPINGTRFFHLQPRTLAWNTKHLSHSTQKRSCSVVSDSLPPMDCNPPRSSVRGILQTRILEWVAISFFMGSSPPRDGTHVSYISSFGRQILYHCTTWEVLRSSRTGLKWTLSMEKNKAWVEFLGTTVGLVLAPRESSPYIKFWNWIHHPRAHCAWIPQPSWWSEPWILELSSSLYKPLVKIPYW